MREVEDNKMSRLFNDLFIFEMANSHQGDVEHGKDIIHEMGKIARKYNLVTNFGKFMDPLADKLLVCAAMICLIETGQLAAWIVIVIISREFIISGFRLVASDNGVVIAANYWGKFKTVSQMIMIILLIVDFGGVFAILTEVFIWLSVALTVLSLLTYIMQNRKVLSMQE